MDSTDGGICFSRAGKSTASVGQSGFFHRRAQPDSLGGLACTCNRPVAGGRPGRGGGLDAAQLRRRPLAGWGDHVRTGTDRETSSARDPNAMDRIGGDGAAARATRPPPRQAGRPGSPENPRRPWAEEPRRRGGAERDPRCQGGARIPQAAQAPAGERKRRPARSGQEQFHDRERRRHPRHGARA